MTLEEAIEQKRLKKLTKVKREPAVTSEDGLRFGLGFWLAFTIFAVLVWPVIACVVFIILTIIGLRS